MRALTYMVIGLVRVVLAASPPARAVARCATVLVTITCLIQEASAQQADNPDCVVSSFTAEELANLKEEALEESARRDFAGISFGVGIAATLIHLSKQARIDDVELVGEPGVVRIKKRTRAPTRLLLESHYFFPLDQEGTIGLGPFLALQPGTGELVEAVGFGAMLGFRRGNASTQSFNMGLGGLVDASSPVLGPGVEEDKPLPPGETTVRLQNRSVFSWLALFSFSF